MASDRGDRSTEPTLRPVRWPTGPRRATVLRGVLVAVLLTLAAGVLLLGRGSPDCQSTGPGHAAPQRSAAPDLTPPTNGSGPVLPAGSVGVPVRLAEPAALAVVRPGSRVDLLAVAPSVSGEPLLMAPRALVLDVLGPTGAATVDGSALYLALRPEQADRVISLPEGSRLAIVVRG